MDTTFVIKGSKLCNMRCSYCYEWDELDRPDRISLDLWRKIFVAMREQHAINLELSPATRTTLLFHGGEPLILPIEYRRAVMDLRREVLGENPRFLNHVQTNLLQLTEETLAWLEDHAFHVGVSFDVVPGVRVGLAGRETERTVIRNMERLRERGISFGAIAVLAKHTAPRIVDVYDFFADRGMSFRILPLVPGPATRPEAAFAMTLDEMERSLDLLFRHWIETGMRARVVPLDVYLEATLRKIVGVEVARLSRRVHGESTFVVNTDGGLFVQDEDYTPPQRLGDLNTQTLPEIRASVAYQRSLDASDAAIADVCRGCEYAVGCDGWPVIATSAPREENGRCPIAFRVQRNIERYLRDEGFDRDELRAMLREHFGLEPPLTSKKRVLSVTTF